TGPWWRSSSTRASTSRGTRPMTTAPATPATAARPMTEWRRRAGAPAALVAILVVAGCSNPSHSPSASGGAGQTPQPSVTEMEVADPADRVDLAMPTFTNPTEITNPLFPIALQSSNLLVG